VLGFYRSEEHGGEALSEVRKNGFRRSAIIHRASDGGLKHFHDGLGSRERAAFGLGMAFAVAALATAAGIPPWAVVPSALSGFLVTWFGTLWLGLGIRNGILRGYRGFVLPGESLVVVEATEAEAADVIAALRRIAQPSVFALRPGRGFTAATETAGQRHEPITMASLPDCAAELAASHELESSTRSRPLLPILRDCEIAIERARADLAEAARLEYGITHATEWLLDNGYLIRSNIADIRHNLPDNHNKILPVLTDRSCPVRLRVYHLAAKLIDSTGHRLSAETIISFLDAYQHQSPLTIAELWVFPLMLRLVLLERLCRLSASTSLRQHQKELADLWADRLLNAAHRTPEQFEEMVAELDRRGDELRPHFIARLGEQLHQEESALAPIQTWIQEKMEHRLSDIIRGEHADETDDLMLIASAIGSLRQLSELQYPKIVEAVAGWRRFCAKTRQAFMSEAISPRATVPAGLSKQPRASRSSPNGMWPAWR
jgi:cyclic beta-1,2-glucan synthetase